MSTETESSQDAPGRGRRTPADPADDATYRAWEEKQPSERLADWLASLVHTRNYGDLAQLRRPRVRTNTHIRAGWFNPDQREVYEQVAFLFAVYHRGLSRPPKATGTLGDAARRIGSGVGRGPDDPGAARLIDRIVASRRIPWRHLQHAVARLRACDQPPPSWSQLADDLTRWNDRKARIPYHWAVAFHTPPSRSKSTRSITAASAPATDTIQKGTTQ
ncbi:type I-E CRISPR-associated protein Cse2/CasB [Streptomyces sp. NPDC086023]|uniref:type I-E CRISPR-associated protein Cse2/CasB n=1 Tax=Streptomyces sp. NPDC086023 TaxID=3365746 RepID=UPI0037D2010E